MVHISYIPHCILLALGDSQNWATKIKHASSRRFLSYVDVALQVLSFCEKGDLIEYLHHHQHELKGDDSRSCVAYLLDPVTSCCLLLIKITGSFLKSIFGYCERISGKSKGYVNFHGPCLIYIVLHVKGSGLLRCREKFNNGCRVWMR